MPKDITEEAIFQQMALNYLGRFWKKAQTRYVSGGKLFEGHYWAYGWDNPTSNRPTLILKILLTTRGLERRKERGKTTKLTRSEIAELRPLLTQLRSADPGISIKRSAGLNNPAHIEIALKERTVWSLEKKVRIRWRGISKLTWEERKELRISTVEEIALLE